MLAGLMFCKVCQRRMVSHWVHDRESYRCMHGRTSAHIRRKDRQRTVYARQDEDFLFLATHLPQLRGLYDGHLADPTTARQVLDAFHGERELAVRCDNYTWRVEIDDDLAFDGFPVRLPRKKTARRPRTARTPPERSSGANALGVQLLCPRGDLNPHALYGH
ncbi:zinc ribbon domain-containing protein [Catellatospora sp. IY07-71]|uniref:zinc ribbon domain-containing protein n=1 Tax=Catellatospora sp. IY07-71 TaxID=2728827 RepID=UPI003530152E